VKAKIVVGPERAQKLARESVARARDKVFGARPPEPLPLHERAARNIAAVMEAVPRAPWWRRAWAWVRARLPGAKPGLRGQGTK
jgi:hypothetical protein